MSYGPYEALAPLGRGGSATVYRARRSGDGAEVALKVLHSRDPETRAGFRREARLLGLLHHPGVVSVYEHALEVEEPWCAMELVAGTPLDSSWREGPASPRAALDAFASLCRTLAFVHGEGVVHRDLKPENVLLRPDGGTVLVDFGLGARFTGPLAREDLEAADGIVGSFAYMAPEQAAGGPADARADLYALGCMLYAALTGAPPFAGTPWDLIEQHRRAMPEPPSRRAGGIEPGLDALVLSLLAKKPSGRPGYAADVADALERLGAAADPSSRAGGSRPYLYRPGFVGREAALGRIRAALERAEQGRGGALLLVVGESGAGKTRLALEATREGVNHRFAVSVGSGLAIEGAAGLHELHGAALHPLRPFLRDVAGYCQHAGAAATGRVLPEGAGILATYEPALAALRPGPPEPAAALPARALREQLLGAIGSLARSYAAERRLLLVLDDLQWADDATLDLLAGLPPELLADVPLVILATCRREEIPAAIREISGPHVELLDLARLEPGAVGAIAADMLAMPELPSDVVRFLSEQSEGNPFFVAEYLRSALDAGWLVRHAGAWQLSPVGAEGASATGSLPLPDPLRTLLDRRLAALDADARRWLEAAAVLGRDFEAGLADLLAGGPAAPDAIAELLRREILEESGGSALRFAHDKLREAAYGEIAAPRRAALHGAAARALEERLTAVPGPGDDRAALAHHWSEAGFPERALPHFGAAGERALQLGAHRDAERLLSRAIEIDRALGEPATPLERARWQRLCGEACVGSGDLDASLPHALAAASATGRAVPRSRARWVARLGAEIRRELCFRWRGGMAAVAPAARSLHREASLATGQAATTFYFRSELPEALACSLACIHLAESAGSPGLGALACAQVGYVLGSARLERLARRYFHLAGRGDADSRDPNAHAGSLYFRAMYEMGLGQWAQSEASGLEALASFEAIENRQEAEVARTIVANTRYFHGRVLASELLSRELLASAERRWNTQHTGWGLMLCGRALLALGRFPEARDLLERGRTHLARVQDEVSTVMCEGLLASARLRTGDGAGAYAVARSLQERLRRLGLVPLAQCLDGYGSLAVVLLELERDGAAGVPPREELRRAAVEAARGLRRFSWMFPMARPVARRARALRLALDGRVAAARRRSDQAIALAGALDMPREAALAHAERACFTLDPAERRAHAAAAANLARAIGCTVEALGGPST